MENRALERKLRSRIQREIRKGESVFIRAFYLKGMYPHQFPSNNQIKETA